MVVSTIERQIESVYQPESVEKAASGARSEEYVIL